MKHHYQNVSNNGEMYGLEPIAIDHDMCYYTIP